MSDHFPDGPDSLPKNFASPNSSYKFRARLAFLALLAFLLFYLGLCAWLFYRAYENLSDASGKEGGFEYVLVGVASGVLGFFLLKGLFFRIRRGESSDIEIFDKDQPELFAFFHDIADRAGAPRPHRVFITPDVNASVSYDINLIIPSKKNLRIGLGLVNALNRSEFKAVLAHEFGHFAQKTMAVGRWVYQAQFIAQNIVAKRDWFDSFLLGLSRTDIRIAWVGWALRLFTWSLRAVFETVFRWVILAERALSREMEFQADLVSVSICGSDPLINGLHRLGPADRCWDEALSIVSRQIGNEKRVPDLFAVQARVQKEIGRVLREPDFGASPRETNAPEARIFTAEMAQAPQMWSTHPSNVDREANAKKRFVGSDADERSAWSLFRNEKELRLQSTESIFTEASGFSKLPEISEEELRKAIAERYVAPALDEKYRGFYLNRNPAELEKKAADALSVQSTVDTAAKNDGFYDQSASDVVEELQRAERDHHALEAISLGLAEAPGGVIRHRDRMLTKKELPEALEEAKQELEQARHQVRDLDRAARQMHLALAKQLGGGWEAYLTSLFSLLHCSTHTLRNVQDARGHLQNVWSVVIADGRVSSAELRRLIGATQEVWFALQEAYALLPQVVFPEPVLERIGAENVEELTLGQFEFAQADEENIQSWMENVDSWVNAAIGTYRVISDETLNVLLETEEMVFTWAKQGSTSVTAPAPAQVPDKYTTLVDGEERPRQRKLDWWDSFQTADGVLPTITRFLAAAGILGVLAGFGSHGTKSEVYLVNGLPLPVNVSINGSDFSLAANEIRGVELAKDVELQVRAETGDGWLIEEFQETESNDNLVSIYNVGSVAPLVKYFANYGSSAEREPIRLSTDRWIREDADYFFKDPPSQISTSGSGGQREVITSALQEPIQIQLANVPPEEVADFAARRFALIPANDPSLPVLAVVGGKSQKMSEAMARRLERDPNDVPARRARQDDPATQEAGCKKDLADAENKPNNADLAYLAARCQKHNGKDDEAFLTAYEQHPEHLWIARAAGLAYLERQEFDKALGAWETVERQLDGSGEAAEYLARLRRLSGKQEYPDARDIQGSPLLQAARSNSIEVPFFQGLMHGDLEGAKSFISNSADQAYEIRLLGASVGADSEDVERALHLTEPPTNRYHETWIMLALALREGQEVSRWSNDANEQMETKYNKVLMSWLKERPWSEGNLKPPKELNEGPSFLPQLLAVVYDPEGAPQEYRRLANGWFFPAERPYLGKNAVDGKAEDEQ